MSKGEEKISKLLKQSHIYFEKEKSFHDLKQGLFRFDFFVPDLHGGPAAIEFQGQQHYQFVSKFFKQRADFLRYQNNDRRKISYCLANNIKIYCIPYWEIDNLITAKDCFSKKYLATTRWKNDDDWKQHKTKAN